MNRLLIVDRAEEATSQFSRIGRRLGYATERAPALADFVAYLETFSPSVVLLDLQSVQNDGLDHLKALKQSGCNAKVVLVSDTGTRALETAKQLAEFLGLSVVAGLRSSIIVNVVRHELRKARHSTCDLGADDLRRAIENGEIRPFYQPKASYLEERGWPITEVEALPRWHITETEAMMPEEFASMAESCGMMSSITLALLEQVIAQMQRWRARRIGLTVAVNLPASILDNTTLVDDLLQRMRAAKLKTSDLIFEVPESLAMNHSTAAIEILGQLKRCGFRLAIDEFGTSYSSLEQLYRLKFDELKIDPALVQEARVSGEARTIIEATVLIGQKLGLSVCGEGVDSQGTLEYLGRIGCNKAQGSYIGQPLHARLLEERMQEWNLPASRRPN